MNSNLTDAEIKVIPEFILKEKAFLLFKHLQSNISWEQHYVTIFGRRMASPRLSAWYGERNTNYSYSGQHLTPTPWTTRLQTIRNTIKEKLDLDFNSVLINYYRTGSDNMGWHSDDETTLGKNPIIASLSLGGTRRFVLKHKSRKDLGKLEYDLGNGDLLIMSGSTQHFWKHQIPRTRKHVKPRINLTFRRIINK